MVKRTPRCMAALLKHDRFQMLLVSARLPQRAGNAAEREALRKDIRSMCAFFGRECAIVIGVDAHARLELSPATGTLQFDDLDEAQLQ